MEHEIKSIDSTQQTNSFFQEKSKSITQAASLVGRFVVKEAGLMGVSAVCGYIGTRVFAEVPVNIAAGTLSLFNLVDYPQWIGFNPTGMAILAAGSVPVFQLTNKILPQAINSDGTKKNEYFGLSDAKRIATAGLFSYASTKVFETVISGVTKLTSTFNYVNSYDSTVGTVGFLGGITLGKGIYDLVGNEIHKPNDGQPQRINKLALVEVIAGSAGLAYTGLKTAYNYTHFNPAEPPSGFPCVVSWWSWKYLGAPGMAARTAIGVPIQILARQVFGQVMYNPDVPEVVRKGTEIVAATAGIVGSTAIAAYLGLPGASLSDPYETFKSMAMWMGGMWVLEKGVTSLVDKLFPDEVSSEVDSEEALKLAEHLKQKQISRIPSAPTPNSKQSPQAKGSASVRVSLSHTSHPAMAL